MQQTEREKARRDAGKESTFLGGSYLVKCDPRWEWTQTEEGSRVLD